MLILSFCNRQRFDNNFSIVVVIIIDIYFAFIYQFLFLKFWWSFSNCNTTLILNTVIVCLNCSTFNSFVYIVIFYFDKSVTLLYHLTEKNKFCLYMKSQFRISLFYGYHKVKIMYGSKSCYINIFLENLDWVAQSTIKVNLLLKVLLKLIVNYFSCTNVN